MQTQVKINLIGYSLLIATVGISMLLPATLGPQNSVAAPSPRSSSDIMYLTGKVRDFKDEHPDFGITDSSRYGHTVGTISQTLDAHGIPDYWNTGAGKKIVALWYDKNGNPIMPYAPKDSGLPGGHFDVDVHDKLGTKPYMHIHEYDDKYDVNYVDIANDTRLKFKSIIPASYPNNLRAEFINHANGGGGSYSFKAGATVLSGTTASGFPPTVFKPSELTEFKVVLAALANMAHTSPGDVQKNSTTRNGAFGIRMYNTVTNALVYELNAYHHGKLSELTTVVTTPKDYCGVNIVDTPGIFGADHNAGISNDASFASWFTDEMETNLSTKHTIGLTKGADGVYEYYDDQFFPIDYVLYGNEGKAHNSLFTYTISATFTYKKCTGQFFEFQGQDDSWLFINNQLVMDLGGLNHGAKQHVALDRLELTDGQTVTFEFFYANRRDSNTSLFHMRTNLELFTPFHFSVTQSFD